MHDMYLPPAPADQSVVAGANAVRRATPILRMLAHHEVAGVQLKQIVAVTGIPAPSARRLLKCLIEDRLVVQNADHRYFLGPLNFELGLATLHNSEFSRRFRPLVESVARLTGDTVYLAVRAGTDIICLDKVIQENHRLPMGWTVGGRRPLGYGAVSIALLATEDDAELERIMACNAREIELHPRLSQTRIMRAVARARETGFGDQRDIGRIGVCGIGVIIPNTGERPAYAISAATDREQMTPAHADMVRGVLSAEVKKFTAAPLWPF